ncbi:Trimethylamine dehydrogenase [Geodia barretti]|uniref:Trimethylamine dehydrogenase n=1 Tax=Geodia barretti TaxID=519541 RepID=A0AA35R842_GEOBA|nr:Trimethylamine dehydrogenase [Geodia barretti]
MLQPIAIGPVTARNRFYQVPHCTGMGYRDPTALAHMRGVKAEGLVACRCTQSKMSRVLRAVVFFFWRSSTLIRRTSEITPFIELRLWDDRDIPMLARMADHIHAHGALAGLELCYNAASGPNVYSRASA